ncbi:hypothetical protein D3C78_1385120 [compost metagenome]
MAVSMAQIQQRAQPAFAFVSSNHFSFQLAAATDTVGQSLHIQRHQGIDIVFQPDEEIVVENNPVLDHFSQTRGELTRR